jgi:hypothetical protein
MIWKPCTEERYDEMLGILPPALQTGFGFLVGEPYDHNRQGQPRFAAFIICGDKFYESDTPLTRREFQEAKRP